MNKVRRLDDKGFTLVELIIVMAIIVVLSGISMVTMTLIRSAKVKDAGVTMNSEVSALKGRAQNQVCVLNDVQKEEYLPALKLYVSGKYCYVARAYYDTTSTAGITAESSFVDDTDETINGGKGVSLSSYTEVVYTDSDGNETKFDEDNDSSVVYIVFNRKGTCISGAGTYSFHKVNGNEVISLDINKNGSRKLN